MSQVLLTKEDLIMLRQHFPQAGASVRYPLTESSSATDGMMSSTTYLDDCTKCDLALT
jgi:hypothetical protein